MRPVSAAEGSLRKDCSYSGSRRRGTTGEGEAPWSQNSGALLPGPEGRTQAGHWNLERLLVAGVAVGAGIHPAGLRSGKGGAGDKHPKAPQHYYPVSCRSLQLAHPTGSLRTWSLVDAIHKGQKMGRGRVGQGGGGSLHSHLV